MFEFSPIIHNYTEKVKLLLPDNVQLNISDAYILDNKDGRKLFCMSMIAISEEEEYRFILAFSLLGGRFKRVQAVNAIMFFEEGENNTLMRIMTHRIL